ncbi:MAG: D-aminoacyl-tRNA deacylase [Elusimicrobiota bacterium]|nr:D-aminoacyl-tRNA deacylase [Elusimicrobiota bacterium]
MKAVVQRVSKAKVIFDDTFREISRGLVVLVGIDKNDTEEEVSWLVNKILNLRIFSDEKDKFNYSLLDIKGDVLVVSQFTLLADCNKGRRPDFTQAASPDKAKPLYEKFVELLKPSGLNIQTGEFQAKMSVEIHNDGPVTVIIDSKKQI